MLIYLDLNVYYRDYDDQTQLKIRRESKAIDRIFEFVDKGNCQLCGSFMLDEENNVSPLLDIKMEVTKILSKCSVYTKLHPAIKKLAEEIASHSNARSKDALHLACAVYNNCEYFITCDDRLIKTISHNESLLKGIISKTKILNPVNFVDVELNNDARRYNHEI